MPTAIISRRGEPEALEGTEAPAEAEQTKMRKRRRCVLAIALEGQGMEVVYPCALALCVGMDVGTDDPTPGMTRCICAQANAAVMAPKEGFRA